MPYGTKNCIYADGSVIPIPGGDVCPVENNGAELIDETTLNTTVNVTTPDPNKGTFMIAGLLFLATLFGGSKKKR